MNVLRYITNQTNHILLACIFLTSLSLPHSLAASQTETAVNALLLEAKTLFASEQYEQAAVRLERALRIDPRNSVLWHNLAGVRLQQEAWARAASLAAKSNALAINDEWLRIRNWTVIALACEGMGDIACTREARSRARALNTR